jgi:uncharacterized cupin superfamily protein
MTNHYRRANLTDLETNEQKPGRRYEVSPQLDLEAYNYNVATLDAGTRLSQNAYHYHENQTEFFHVLDGRCRAEVEEGAFVLGTDDLVAFEPGVAHLLHNPYEQPCRVIAIGSPPEGRYPVEQVQSYDDLLEERYDGDVPTEESNGETSDTE